MDWGLHLPHLGRQATRDTLINFARTADRIGVHSVWSSDHIAWPREVNSKYPYTGDGSFPGGYDTPWLDPIGTLFTVAGCTERVKLGTTVLVLGYRPPLLTAKAWASLDVISGGRAIVGVGVGWMKEEFDVLEMPFDHRGARSDEQLDIYRATWTEDEPSFDGRYYRFPTIGFSPKPIQDPLPIWVGGDTEPAFRRTVKYGQAFHAAFQPIDEVAAAWARIRKLADEAGRDPNEITLSIRLYLDPDSSQEPKKSIAGSDEQMADSIGRWADIGVTHILLDPVARGGPERRLAEIERFVTGVGARV
ncbi:MAG: LLM class F420-dependent oxidoreductase [Acidimicrobiales bacterium]